MLLLIVDLVHKSVYGRKRCLVLMKVVDFNQRHRRCSVLRKRTSPIYLIFTPAVVKTIVLSFEKHHRTPQLF